MNTFKKVILIIVFCLNLNEPLDAQNNDFKNCSVEIHKLKTKKSKYRYNPKNRSERVLFIENEFQDSLSICVNDSCIKKDYYKTNFSSGTTGKQIFFTSKADKNLRVIIKSYASQAKCSQYSFIIKRKILRNYKIFFIYKIESQLIVYYSNYIPYYE